jgi:2-polyprenyl-6-methoxyphenol hydroxylase-like FAD-dependent oxidoreductase
MDITIIGGGIGGLTLTLAVHDARAASRIRIFEATPDIRALGVGINLGPHAVKELSAFGLQDALVARCCTPQDYAFFTRHGQQPGLAFQGRRRHRVADSRVPQFEVSSPQADTGTCHEP